MKLDDTMPIQQWVWIGIVDHWHDGDTLVLNADKGFRDRSVRPVRLIGLNAPELKGPQAARALQAKVLAETLAPAGATVIVRTFKSNGTEKFDRWLAQVWNQVTGQCVNTALLASGLADPDPG